MSLVDVLRLQSASLSLVLSHAPTRQWRYVLTWGAGSADAWRIEFIRERQRVLTREQAFRLVRAGL
jgi:hypothetical protein